MSTDREARLLAAGDIIDIVGEDGKTKQYKLRPVVAQHLCDLEREALRDYKRQYLETFTQNADLLPGGAEIVQKKFEEVARWDFSDLPKKTAYSVAHILPGDVIRAWIKDTYNEVPETDSGIRAVLVNSLDNGKISMEEVQRMCGKAPIRGTVRYDQWWVTASMAGMISFITSSVRYEHPEMTREKVAQWPFQKVAEAARTVESITAAKMGNT